MSALERAVPAHTATRDEVNAQRLALVRERLQTLRPTRLDVIDESHLHVGHAGARNGASHLRVHIVSPRFDQLSRIQCHQLVYDELRDLIPFPIHALAIVASPHSTKGNL